MLYICVDVPFESQRKKQQFVYWLLFLLFLFIAYLDPFFARGNEVPGELGFILFYNSTKEDSYTDEVCYLNERNRFTC
jgi:hypothetical protein